MPALICAITSGICIATDDRPRFMLLAPTAAPSRSAACARSTVPDPATLADILPASAASDSVAASYRAVLVVALSAAFAASSMASAAFRTLASAAAASMSST